MRPLPGDAAPTGEFLFVIGRCYVVIALLQPRIDKVRRHIANFRIGGVVGMADGDAIFGAQRRKLRHDETWMADFHDMAQFQTRMFAREKAQKGFEIIWLELFCVGELPDQRAEFRPQLLQPLGEEFLHRLSGLGQHFPVGDKAVALDGKYKTVRRFSRPFRIGRRRETRIVGAVDLNGFHL